eukprot:1160681-Pelagomonas_calceolata.AAC.3
MLFEQCMGTLLTFVPSPPLLPGGERGKLFASVSTRNRLLTCCLEEAPTCCFFYRASRALHIEAISQSA